MVSALDHAMGDAFDGIFRAGHDEEVEGDEEASGLRFGEEAGVGLAAEVLSRPKDFFLAINSSALACRMRPARTAASSGFRGERPRAISSAFRKRSTPSKAAGGGRRWFCRRRFNRR
jgi:hypothetical protein